MIRPFVRENFGTKFERRSVCTNYRLVGWYVLAPMPKFRQTVMAFTENPVFLLLNNKLGSDLQIESNFLHDFSLTKASTKIMLLP